MSENIFITFGSIEIRDCTFKQQLKANPLILKDTKFTSGTFVSISLNSNVTIFNSYFQNGVAE
jgi:hypothetical protein